MSVSTRPEYMGVPDGNGPVVLVGVALLHGLDLHWHDHELQCVISNNYSLYCELKFTILAFPEA